MKGVTFILFIEYRMPTHKKRGGSYSVKYAGKEAAGNLRPRENTLRNPNISYNSSENELYTIIIYDPDAPNPSFLHWLIVNIPEDKIQDGDTIVDYKPPTPPSGQHRYYVNLYKQTRPLQLSPPERSRFNIQQFVQKNNLQEIGSKMIQVASTN